MPHPKDDELIPLDTVVLIIDGPNKGKKARIKKYGFQSGEKGFLHYLGYISGKGTALYALYHDNLTVVVQE